MVCNPVEQRKKTPSPAAREWHGTRFPLCHKETVLLVRDNVQRSRIASSVSTTISWALVLGLVRANKKPAATTTTSGTARLSWWWQRKRETPWRLPAQPRTQTRSVLFCSVLFCFVSCRHRWIRARTNARRSLGFVRSLTPGSARGRRAASTSPSAAILSRPCRERPRCR